MKRRLALVLCALLTSLALISHTPASAQSSGELIVACDWTWDPVLTQFVGPSIARINTTDGSVNGRILSPVAYSDLEIGPDGRLYVVDVSGSKIMAYNLLSGAESVFVDMTTVDDALAPYMGTALRVNDGGILLGRAFEYPVGLAFGTDGNLFVSGIAEDIYTLAAGFITWNDSWQDVDIQGRPAIQRYNAATGASIGDPVSLPGANGYWGWGDIVLGGDGKFYIAVSIWPGHFNSVLRYDTATGTVSTFVTPDNGNLKGATQMAFGPDGNLYVASQTTHGVKCFRGTGDNPDRYLGDLLPDGAYDAVTETYGPGDAGRGNLVYTFGLAFGRENGNDYLYVSSIEDNATGAGSIHKYRVVINPGTGRLEVSNHVTLVTAESREVSQSGFLQFNGGLTQPAGTNTPVTVAPTATSSITFSEVTTAGQTTVTPLDSATTSLPENFEVATASGGFASYFDITTTIPATDVAKGVTLSFAYDPTLFKSDQNSTGPNPKLLHFENGTWVDITSGFDMVTHKVFGYTTSFSPFAIVKRAAYAWSGVLQPINPDGSSIFKKGSTVPVKFKLTGVDAGITNLNAKLYLAQTDTVDPVTTNEAVSTATADSGNTFRYDATSGQYIYNLSTKNLDQGTWYLRIDLGDGTNNVVRIKLKK